MLQKPITGEIVTTKWKRDVDYWTTERLREALMNPLDLKDSDEDRVNLTRRKRDRPIWTNEDLRSSPPLDTEISPEILRGLGIEPNDITLLDNELSAKNLADINEYPFSNYGKLFIKSSGGGGHCSAAFIRERVLLTAAHCVRHANGRWFEHFQFYQRFNGIEDQGRIVAVEMPFIYSNYIDDDGGMELRCILVRL